MINQAKLFAALSFHNKCNVLRRLHAIVFTRLYYSKVFGKLGKRCVIYKPLLITYPEYIVLGDYVQIRAGARIEVIMQSVLSKPSLSIGSFVNIEQNVHIVCGSKIKIGNSVSITGGCAIVDVNHPYQDINDPVKIGSRVQCAGNYVEIGDGSFIGFGTIILPNVRIGKYVVIGSHSLVNKDIPDYSVATGNPAKIIRQFDKHLNAWVKK